MGLMSAEKEVKRFIGRLLRENRSIEVVEEKEP